MTVNLGGCGDVAAKTFCRSKGFSRAASFKWTLSAPTYRQGDRDICSGNCGAFTEVTCE